MTRYVVPAALLAGTYLLMLGSVDLWDIGLGAVLAVALIASLRRFLFTSHPGALGELPRRVLRAFPLAGAVLREIAIGTSQVALVVLHARPLAAPGIVAVPIGERTRFGVVMTGVLATLAPGEFLVDVDWQRRVLLFHVLDASDPDAVRARHARFYERYQRPVFP